MRYALIGILVVLAAAGGFVAGRWSVGSSQPGAGAAAEDPDLVSARTTADSFLHALRNLDGGSAFGLLSASYRERMTEQEQSARSMQVALVEDKPVAEWSRNAGALSDGKSRAVFEDHVQTKDRKQFGYRLVLVKENAVWRVDLFTVKK